jgi:poly(3-hydroxyalkanoate) synthetase
VQLFDQPLNIKNLIDLNVPWYQNYAIKDDLVTPPCATAGNKFLEGWNGLESVAFFGGHVAILTSPYGKKAPVTGTFKDANGKDFPRRACHPPLPRVTCQTAPSQAPSV